MKHPQTFRPVWDAEGTKPYTVMRRKPRLESPNGWDFSRRKAG